MLRALALASALMGLPCMAAAEQTEAADRPIPNAGERSAGLAGLRPTLHLLAGTDEPFGLSGFERPGAAIRKWRRAAAAVERDRDDLGYCRITHECSAGARSILAIIEEAQPLQGRALLASVNRAVNLAIRYRSDAVRHGAADAWSAPLAALAAGEGDCEDYAIAKYLALREAGVRPGDLRFVLVRDIRLEQDHAVLAARSGERWLLLDNRRFSLVEDRDAHAYRPVAAFGPQTGLFHFAADDGDAWLGSPRL